MSYKKSPAEAGHSGYSAAGPLMAADVMPFSNCSSVTNSPGNSSIGQKS